MEEQQTTSTPKGFNWKETSKRLLKYDVLGSIALVLAIVGLVNDCGDSKRDIKSQDLLNRLNYRPRLEVVKIEFVESRFKSKVIDFSNLQADSNGVIDIDGNVRIKFRLTITNTGNHPATLVSKFYMDTTSGEQIIKQMLKRTDQNVNFDHLPDSYYPEQIINEGDTIKDWITLPIAFIKDTTFTFHAFFLYENEGEQLFDTYYRERFKLVSLLFPFTGVKTEFKLDDQPIKSIDKSPSTSRSYNLEEAEKLLKSIERVMK